MHITNTNVISPTRHSNYTHQAIVKTLAQVWRPAFRNQVFDGVARERSFTLLRSRICCCLQGLEVSELRAQEGPRPKNARAQGAEVEPLLQTPSAGKLRMAPKIFRDTSVQRMFKSAGRWHREDASSSWDAWFQNTHHTGYVRIHMDHCGTDFDKGN